MCERLTPQVAHNLARQLGVVKRLSCDGDDRPWGTWWAWGTLNSREISPDVVTCQQRKSVKQPSPPPRAYGLPMITGGGEQACPGPHRA